MAANEVRDFKQMHLTARDVTLIFSLYIVLFLAGLGFVLRGIYIYTKTGPDGGTAALYCVAMSLVGSSAYYIRKLYKSLINESYTFIENADRQAPLPARMKRIGTLAFFLFRPLLGSGLSIVVYSFWRLSLSASGTASNEPTVGFLFTTISLGFISGFLAGRLLTMLEGYGTKRLGGLLGGEE